MKRSVISIILIVLLVSFLLPLNIITRDMIDKKASPAVIANYLVERIGVHEVDLE